MGPPTLDHEQADRSLFDSIAERYCRKDLVASSRTARQHRLLQALNAIELTKADRLLEVGCGAGFSARYLEGSYREYVGIDHSAELIGYARLHNAIQGASYEVANIKDYEPDEGFNVILLIGVLHHMANLPALTRRMVDMLKPSGWLVASEPQPANPIITVARSIRKRVDPSYSSDQRELSRAELHDLLLEVGLENLRVVPQGLVSTPFAEVVFPLQGLSAPMSQLACSIDRTLERSGIRLLGRLTWNLTVAGRRPG